MVQIRNVPDALHRRLKARAALEGKWLSDYLLAEIAESAEQPTVGDKQTLFDGWRGWRAEQDFEDDRSVDDDHRELRSSRRMTAGFRAGETGRRPARRARR